MNVSVILAHPYDKSFNHGIFEHINSNLISTGHTLYAHDLYAEKFDPLLTKNELEKARQRIRK